MSHTGRSIRQKGMSGFVLHAARLLLLLMALLVVAMPFTEHFWVFDRFLQSGQDFELSLLAILAVFSLFLLLGHSLRKTLQILLVQSIRGTFWIRGTSVRPEVASTGAVCFVPPIFDPASAHPSGFSLPLQI